MKSIARVLFVAAAVLMLDSCGSPAAPPPSANKPLRTGSGNADLQGPDADEVIWQSTRQWHADRWHDRRRR